MFGRSDEPAGGRSRRGRWTGLVGAGLSVAAWACGPDSASGVDPGSELAGDLPRVGVEALRYVGAFRLPAGTFGGSDLNYSEGPLAVDGSALFIVGHAHHQAVAEFVVPGLGASTRPEELPMADAPVQPFIPLLDRAPDDPDGLDRIGGLALVAGAEGRLLLVSAYEYYDAPGDNRRTTLVVRDPARLATSPVDGAYALGGAAHAAGWMSPVPAPWGAAVGAPMIAGASSGIPIVSRTSVGPSAFAFDPADLRPGADPGASVPTRALLDYDLTRPLHDDLSNASGGNDLWTHLSRAVFGFVVPGTRTYLVVGHSGGHGARGVCYKCVPDGGDAPCGGYCARDPDDAGPFFWAYDVEELVAAGSGERPPYGARPYAYGPFTPPFPAREIGGGAYDADTGLLYLTLQRADRTQGPYANPPIVAVYEVR